MAAGDLAQLEPDPRAWTPWLTYLLDCLEVKAMDLDQAHPQAYELALQQLQDVIAARFNNGRW